MHYSNMDGFFRSSQNNEPIDKGATYGIADPIQVLILFSFYKLAVSVSLVYWFTLHLTSRRSPVLLLETQEGDLAYHSTKSNM